MRSQLCWLLLLAVGTYLLFPVVQRSHWNKNRLYHRLLTGNQQQQLIAASTLAHLGAQSELLRVLQSDNAPARAVGRRALEHIWFNAAGKEAYELMTLAYKRAESNELSHALTLLDGLLKKYPRYAEGWNRRAAVHWQLGEYEESIADSEKALVLNPNHYGAWQGLGMCQLQRGNISEACRCLRAASRLIPHDPATREALQKCESLLRVYPMPQPWKKPLDLVHR